MGPKRGVPKTSKPKKATKPPCPTCGPIGDEAWAIWKDCDPEWIGARSTMPVGAGRLIHIAGDENAPGGRGRALKQCPDCGAWFDWVRSYEFLANGSEDEETLTLIDDERAAEWIARSTAKNKRLEEEAQARTEHDTCDLGTDALG